VPQTVMRHGGDIRPNPASPGKSLRSFRLGGEPVLWEVVYSYVSNFELSPSEGSPPESCMPEIESYASMWHT
jgi:hypothetical protein